MDKIIEYCKNDEDALYQAHLKKVAIDYLRDSIVTPSYYSLRKEWIIEYAWEHWAAEEIYIRMTREDDRGAKEIIEEFIKEMDMCLHIATGKDHNGAIILFETAREIGREIDSLFRALE